VALLREVTVACSLQLKKKREIREELEQSSFRAEGRKDWLKSK